MKTTKLFLRLYLILLFLPHAVICQKRIPLELNKYREINSKFEKIAVLKENKNETDLERKKVVKEATFASFNTAESNKIIINQYETIEIQIPFRNKLIDVELYRVNLFSENFKINTDKLKNIAYPKGIHYRGIIKGDKNSVASFNFFENEMNGIVSSTDLGNLNVGKLKKKLNKNDYIVYSDSDLLTKNEFVCNTKEDIAPSYSNTLYNRNTLTNKCVTAYFEIGYQAFEANERDWIATTNWIASIFNNSQTLFYNDGIFITLKSIFIWTNDDYYSTNSSFILPAFTNIRPDFDGDVGFIADVDPSSLGGQAFSIGGLCSDRKYAYGDLVLNYASLPTYSQPVYVVTHELGHVLGSHHTHACVWNGNNTAIDGCATTYGGCPTPDTPTNTPGTIMSYCFPDFTLGFGTQPANAMIQHINNAPCLGSDCVNSCINTIGSIEVLNTTQTTANIQWTDSNNINSQWNISVVPYGNVPVWTTVTTNSYSLNNLTPNTHYEVTLAGNCSNGLTYPNHSRIFATQGDNCAGTIIYDTGGATAGYKGNEHIIRTIVPTIPNKKIRLTFNNFSIVPWDAWLFVYDGLDNNGPLLNYLTFGYPFLAYGFGASFSPLGNTFESQDSSGALTLEFFSRPYYFNETPNNGWKATVSCVNNLGNEEFGDGFIDYSYSPNPVKDRLHIKSKDTITEVKIYSMSGKLLLTKIVEETDINVDLSTLANGNYITKLFFDISNTSFKIIKE